MSALKVRLEELLGLTYALQHARYSDRDYSEVRKTLKTQFPDGSIPPSEAIVRHTREPRKAPVSMSFEKPNFRRIKGFKISQTDLSDLIGKSVSVTFYGKGMEPLFRKGRLIELSSHYALIETHMTAMHFYVQFFRIIRVEVYEGKHAIKEIWYDKKNH